VSDSLVIIPTYNEKENIERMVRKVFSLPKDFHLLIVDDGSPDGTAAIVKELQKEFEGRLFIMERVSNGRLQELMSMCLKWTAISLTIQMIWCVYTLVAKTKVVMCRWVQDMLKVEE